MRKAWLLALLTAGCAFEVPPAPGQPGPNDQQPATGLPAIDPPAVTQPMPASHALQDAVDALVAEVGSRTPGTDVAIAVKDLLTGEYAQVDDAVPHVSASSAKAVWVAAALDGVGVAAVAPHAQPIFVSSDNYESGAVIDLIGPNAVNDFYWRVGMSHSALTQWSYGKSRVATNSPRALGSDNYLTTGDAVAFLAALDAGTLLDADATAALEGWMTLSPRSGYGGWLGSDLPETMRAGMMHKAGWLPPGCCGDDGYYNTLNDIGLVQAPNGHRLAIAIFARRGDDYWTRQAPFVAHAACVLVAAVDPQVTCP
jgi:beta-lactamase class A